MKWRNLFVVMVVLGLVAFAIPAIADIGAKPVTTSYTVVMNGTPITMSLPGAPNRDAFVRFAYSISEEAGQQADTNPTEDQCGVAFRDLWGNMILCWVELPCTDCMMMVYTITVHGGGGGQ